MLKINHFSKTYKSGKKAVDNLNLEIQKGELFGLIGHNGAGKTTTLKSIAGILNFEQGEILIDGKSISKEPVECKKKMAFLPDNPELYDYLTGIEYLNFICDIYRVSSEARTMKIKELADDFDLTSALGNKISSYSHGMKQKLALISAFVHNPDLILMDEPFVGLDPLASFKLKNRMKQMCEQGGVIIFSTHVLEVAEKLCTRAAIMKDGHLVVCDKMETLCQNQSLEELFLEVLDE